VVGVTWEWIGLTTPAEKLTVDSPERYTVRLGPDGRASVRADCNRGATEYAIETDRRIAFKAIALTRMACIPPSLGDRFAKEVGRATTYSVRDGDLFLELPADLGTLRFRRQP
jgi:heat shock protein HslJ